MRFFHLFLLVVGVGFAFSAGVLYGDAGKEATATALFSRSADTQPTDAELEQVWKMWRVLEEKYVSASTTEHVSREDRLYGMMAGLARSYGDPYTVFLRPQQTASFKEEISGSFGGVGIEIGIRNDVLTVIAPLRGTPGYESGLMAGDYIVEIDGTTTAGMATQEAVALIRGEVGTDVVLTIAREGEQDVVEVPVTRDVIKVPTLETEVIDNEVFVVSLYNFGGNAINDMRSAMREFVTGGYTKMIIDVRGNPGGYLEASVDIASWFLPAGAVVVEEDFGGTKTDQVHRSKGYGVYEDDWEVVVLIDRGSASASEILAGALRDHGVATLIGTTSFGKGSVQELVDITKDTALKVTIARWLTPNGTQLSEGGLEPDYEVAYTLEDREAEKDPQLDSAVAFLKDGVVPDMEEEGE
jgi:carboxyl-terminal processing protease